jgi:hypothetical protein
MTINISNPWDFKSSMESLRESAISGKIHEIEVKMVAALSLTF